MEEFPSVFPAASQKINGYKNTDTDQVLCTTFLLVGRHHHGFPIVLLYWFVFCMRNNVMHVSCNICLLKSKGHLLIYLILILSLSLRLKSLFKGDLAKNDKIPVESFLYLQSLTLLCEIIANTGKV